VKEELALAIGFVVAGFGPLAVATLLAPLREQPQSTAIVVLALVLAIATSAALAGPTAGAFATVTATLSFDFLFIRPYHALKVDPQDERWPVIVVLAVGLAIVAITRRRRLQSTSASPTSPEPNPSRHIQRIVQLIEQGVDPSDLVSAVQAELTALLLARSCRFDSDDDTVARPSLERDGSVAGRRTDLMFQFGELDLPVRFGTRRLGRFVVEPTPGVVVPFDHRIVAVILTDHLAAALSRSKPTVPPLT
jgi:K+-sensing histidine kinase KdpD